jgi:hypothetical protein
MDRSDDPASLDDRFRIVARATAAWMDSEQGRLEMARRAGEARRNALVDLSNAGIDARFRGVSSARALCLSLAPRR